jgi:glutaredoxin
MLNNNLILFLLLFFPNLYAVLPISDVLMIVNFNSDQHYENANFIKQIYSSTFPKIVFYGESESLKYGIHKVYICVFFCCVEKNSVE